MKHFLWWFSTTWAIYLSIMHNHYSYIKRRKYILIEYILYMKIKVNSEDIEDVLKNKFFEVTGKYGIKANKKDRVITNIPIRDKIIDLYDNDIIDDKCKDEVYIKYLGLYHEYKTKDYNKMEDAYFILLNKGDTEIMIRLGDFYKDTEPDFDEMKRFYLMAIKKGNTKGYMKLANYFKKQNNHLYHKKCLEKALEFADDESLVEKGYYYQFTEKNYELMKQCYDLAIKKSNATAMNNMGAYYCDIMYNYKLGEYYYKMAADKGLPMAMQNLGRIYNRLNRHEEMEKYYQLAIEKDDIESMYLLGEFYELTSNIVEIANQYYQMAADKGHEKSKEKLKLFNNLNNI